MFELDFDSQARLLSIRLRGFWTIAEMEDFENAMRAKLFGVRSAIGEFDCFCDALEFPIQAPIIAARHEALQNDPNIAPRRMAVLTDQVLLRKQSARISQNRSYANFITRDAAMAWLHSFKD